MSELVTVTLKMSAELRDRLKARATAENTSVSALLIAGVICDRPKPVKRLARGQHPSGPVLASAVPEVEGLCKPFFRNEPKQKGAKQ